MSLSVADYGKSSALPQMVHIAQHGGGGLGWAGKWKIIHSSTGILLLESIYTIESTCDRVGVS